MDLVSELKKLDWGYPYKDTDNFICNEDAFEECSTFRLINNKFTDPCIKVIEKPYEDRSPKSKKNKDREQRQKKHEPNNQNDTRKSLAIPLFPEKSLLTFQEHNLGLKVLCHHLTNGFVLMSSLPQTKVTSLESNLFQGLLSKINIERHAFAMHVSKEWNSKNCSRCLYINSCHEKFIEEIWVEQLGSIKHFPQFYQIATMLPIISQSDEEIYLEKIKLLKPTVNYGPRFHAPNIKFSPCLPKTYESVKRKHGKISEESSFPLSRDGLCEKYAEENMANIVISPNSLEHIIAKSINPNDNTWFVPFVVKEYKMKDSKGKPFLHTVVYVDPPLPPKSITTKEKREWAIGVVLKNSLLKKPTEDRYKTNATFKCDYCKGKNDKVLEDSIMNSTEDIKINEKSDADCLSGVESQNSDDEDMLVMDVDESLFSRPSTSTVSGAVTRSRSSKGNIPLIQNKEDAKKEQNKIKLQDSKKCTCINQTHCLNAKSLSEDDFSYSLWKLHQSSDVSILSKTSKKEINILVRSKADGHIESGDTKNSFLLEPKLEYQSEYGYECTTPTEAARQWTLLNFNPNSQLIRARINPVSVSVEMLEIFDVKTFSGEISKQNAWNPTKAKSLLFNIFSPLSQLRPGQYLLGHEERHGAFAVVYSNTPSRCDKGLILNEIYNINVSDVNMKQSAPWIPIDCLLPTRLHTKHKIMPCMFNPHATHFCKPKIDTKKKPLKKTNRKKKRNSEELQAPSELVVKTINKNCIFYLPKTEE